MNLFQVVKLQILVIHLNFPHSIHNQENNYGQFNILSEFTLLIRALWNKFYHLMLHYELLFFSINTSGILKRFDLFDIILRIFANNLTINYIITN